MTESLRLNTGVPKYIQISHWLTEMVLKGRFAVHEKLPSESKLSDLFHVNRNTVRQAISDLVTKGLVQKKNGVGSFVTARAISPTSATRPSGRSVLRASASLTAPEKR